MTDAYVAIGVKDLNASRRFWQEGLGLSVSGEYPNQLCLRCESLEILLDATGEIPSAPGIEIGLRKLRGDLNDTLRRLEALEHRPFRGPKNFGGPLGYEAGIRDPDGHLIVLFDPTTVGSRA